MQAKDEEDGDCDALHLEVCDGDPVYMKPDAVAYSNTTTKTLLEKSCKSWGNRL